ncbi:hypothetical protein AGMMS50229_05880 [Campylobacterota bacterium]|nr:hypothetical protein AGMMS50229_05880 [Campylobacterota bacterium]
MNEQEFSYEELIEKAKAILTELAKPDLPLSKASELFKEGTRLLELASKMLENTRLEYEERQNG